MITYDIEWLKNNYPKAYACLPQEYREGDCLEFFTTWCDNKYGGVHCQPKEDQIKILGNWQMGYCTIHGEDMWIMSPRVISLYDGKID